MTTSKLSKTQIDRNPSYGYRAVHVIVEVAERLVEIQVRTSLQHLWAELSEKTSDVFDPSIKYGGGKEILRTILAATQSAIEDLEGFEAQTPGDWSDEGHEQVEEAVAMRKKQLVHDLNAMIAVFSKMEQRKHQQ